MEPSIEPKDMKRRARSLWEDAGMFLVFAVMFVALAVFVPFFFSVQNMIGLALSVSMVGMVACTMLFCLASGDFDLSVEGTVVLAGVLCAVVMNATGSVTLGVLAGLAGSALVGFLNGAIIAKLKINALITTLAMLYIIRGVSFIVSNGSAVGIGQESFFQLGNGALLGLPNPIWITAVLFVLFGLLLNRTTYGRNTLAIGGNQDAARLAGIPVDRIKIIIFTVQGLVAGAAGIILDVISACVLGGVSLTGGIGTMSGVVVGVLIMGTVQNAMNLMNIPTFYQYLAKGGILLLAVMFDQIKQRKG
jgi:L-arabinose transport system permease protein